MNSANVRDERTKKRTYLVRGDERLGRRVPRVGDPREPHGRDGTSGQKRDRGDGRTQAPVAEARVTSAVGPVDRPSVQHGQHRPADRAQPVRVCRRDARRPTAAPSRTDRDNAARAQLRLRNKRKSTMSGQAGLGRSGSRGLEVFA